MEKENYQFKQNYEPSDKAREIIERTYDRLKTCQDVRDQRYPLLQEMTIEEYINESEKRYVGYIEELTPEYEEEAVEGRIFMPETRNKLNAILSYYTNQRMRVEFSARYKEKQIDKTASAVIQAMYDWSMEEQNGDEAQYMEALECAKKGTVVIFEGWQFQTRDVKYVTGNNFETGEIEFEEKKIVEKNCAYSQVIPLETFYVPNVYEPDVQKQRYVIVTEELSHDEFMGRFGKYPNAEYVPCANMMPDQEDREGRMFFYQRWAGLTKSHMIKIIHEYDKWNDQYNVTANGVLLTPEVNPFVFDHKQYPFVVQRFEILAAEFFYGLSFPMKIATEQDALNALYNLFLMRTYAASNVTIVTSQEDQIEADKLGPFYRIQMENADNMRELQFRPISPGEISVMDKVLESINKSSVDPAQQGQGNQETATGIIAAREATNRLMGTFLNMLGWMVKRKTSLRVANLLQFGSEGSEVLLLGEEAVSDENERLIQEFRTRDQELMSGKRGMRIVRVIHAGELKSASEVEEEEMASEMPVEILEITPERLRSLDASFYIVPNSSTPPTKTLDQALKKEYIAGKLDMFPDLSPRPKLSALFDETFDQNPEEMTVQQQPQMPEGEGGVADQVATQMAGAMQGAGGTIPGAAQEGPSVTQQITESPEKSLKKLVGLQT